MTTESGGGTMPQQAVIAFLSDPASYHPAPADVSRLDTHGAMVFLAGPHAWKIKRAVAFPYMDFSTVEKRRRVIARELKINRRHAPGLYLDVVPIVHGADGRLGWGTSPVDDGRAVEWVLKMRRFDQSALLSALAEAGALDPSLLKELAAVIRRSHRDADIARPASGAAHFRATCDGVAATLDGLSSILPRDAVETWMAAVHDRLAHTAHILDRRAEVGFVRRCHGDLHLANIVLWEGRPTLFDAIEFDEVIATTDTMYDLAFVLMDLDHRGQRAAANRLLNHYLWLGNEPLDLDGLAALPLFLALRAAVRAMVTAERAAQQAGGRKTGTATAARSYLDHALAYLAPPPPRLIAVGGLSGTGKSTLAAALAPAIGGAPGAIHLRTDLERKSLFGAGETERLPPEAYDPNVTARVYDTVRRKAHAALAAGHAVIADAVHAAPEERAAIAAIADALSVPFTGLWLEAEDRTLIARVERRFGDASDATPEVVRRQLAYDVGALGPHWTRIEAGCDAVATLAAAHDALRTLA